MMNICGLFGWCILLITYHHLPVPSSSFLIPSHTAIHTSRSNGLGHGIQQRVHSSSSNDMDNDSINPSSDAWDDNVPGVNIVTVAGRVGNEPEPKYLEDGSCVLNLSLAVRRKYHPLERKARNIENEETDWFGLEIWGRDAEYASKFITKGARIGVTGGLTIDTWTDKNTFDRRSRAKIVVKHLDILETKAESDARLNRQQNPTQYYNNNNNNSNDNQSSWKQKQNNYSNANDQDDTDDASSSSSAGSGGFFDD